MAEFGQMAFSRPTDPGWFFYQWQAAFQHDHHVRNWNTERALWAIEEALGLHQPQPADGWAEWYEYAAAGEWL